MTTETQVGAGNRSVGRRLLSGTINYGLGALSVKIVSFLLVPLYAGVLTPDDFGMLELATTFGGFVAILMRFGVPGAVGRFYFDLKEGPALRTYVSSINRLLWGLSLLIGVAAVVVLAFAPKLVPGLPLWPAGALVVVTSGLNANSELQRRLIQAREQAAYSAKLTFATGGLTTLLTLVMVLVVRAGAVGVLIASAASAVVFFVQARLYLRPELGARPEFTAVRHSLGYAATTLPSHIVNNAAPLMTRAILAGGQSLAAVGIFSMASKVVQPLGLILNAFNGAFAAIYNSVRVSGSREDDQRLRAITRRLWLVAVLCALAAATFGAPLIQLALPAAYAPAAAIVPTLALGFLAQACYVLTSPELFFVPRPWAVPVVSALGAGTTVLLTGLWTAKHGALGLAWAGTVGAWVTTLAGALFARLYRPLLVPIAEALTVSLMAAVAYAAVWLIDASTPQQEIFAGLIAMVTFLAGLFVLLQAFRSDVKAVFAVARRRLAL